MKILLHGCCADCTLKFIESLRKEDDFSQIDVYYYNPNIHPRSEYQARLKAMRQICEEKKIRLIVPDWRPKEYFEDQRTRQEKPFGTSQIKGSVPPFPSQGTTRTRCINCWELRIGKTAEYAKANGYEGFSTTLVTSQYQNSDAIREIGKRTAENLGIIFMEPKVVCCELRTKGFYKQFFCGCVYSLAERYQEKYGT